MIVKSPACTRTEQILAEYKTWERTLPAEITGDMLWNVQGYRLAMFAFDISWKDVSQLRQDRRTVSLSDQLCRSLGSVSANIAEGFSRSSAKERAHFYEYALGSARESRDWYFKARQIVGEEVVEMRINLLTQIIRLLLRMIPNQRQQSKGRG